jgi:hypothetical protein
MNPSKKASRSGASDDQRYTWFELRRNRAMRRQSTPPSATNNASTMFVTNNQRNQIEHRIACRDGRCERRQGSHGAQQLHPLVGDQDGIERSV